MDFSSPTRALESLSRRRPALPDEIVTLSQELLREGNGGTDAKTGKDYLVALNTLLQCDRWEALAVGLFLATQVLVQEAAAIAVSAEEKVYIDGPRVPQEHKQQEELDASGRPLMIMPQLTPEELSQVATWLHQASLLNLEHSEPRVRTFVAKAVGAHATWSVQGVAVERSDTHAAERQAIHAQIVASIQEHIVQGRDTTKEYSQSSAGALDDTTGWRALETNWQCLACWIASLGSRYYQVEGLDLPQLLSNLEHSILNHVNRHVRAAALAVLEQLVTAAGQDEAQYSLLTEGPLRKTLIPILKAGLGDNWSQVRMAASVLNRVVWSTLQRISDAENLAQLYPHLVPRMCLNRFYLAQGVKLYSHQTWKQIFPTGGVGVVAQCLGAVVRYYVQMCDADNHVVREAACQAVAELAVKIGGSEEHAAKLQPHVPILLQALLMCFHDESWPVRDEACLACGTFCRAYPEECRPELETLWTRWTEQLTDQIWSCRSRAAVALGQACQAYGQEFLERLYAFIDENLPAAQSQPKMTMQEYKALQNDQEAHQDLQLYSCGSLAPKLKKKAGAGRIGCSNCDVNRPKQPWEATDGCLYLIRELVETCALSDSTLTPLADEKLLPLFQQVADVCRVSHFPQGDDLRATLWRNLPGMLEAVGKQRTKRLYLEIFLDLLMRNVESRTASAISIHAAGTCCYEIGQLVGPSILKGRVYDDYQRGVLEKILMDREMEERNAAPTTHKTQFSPFEPPGLLDNLDNPFSDKMSPGLPVEMLNRHPGTDDTMSL